MHSFVRWNRIVKLTVIIHRHDHMSWLDEAIVQTHLVIVRSEPWSAVHNTSTCIFSHKLSSQYDEALVLFLLLEKVEQRHIRFPNKILTLHLV